MHTECDARTHALMYTIIGNGRQAGAREQRDANARARWIQQDPYFAPDVERHLVHAPQDDIWVGLEENLGSTACQPACCSPWSSRVAPPIPEPGPSLKAVEKSVGPLVFSITR